MYGVRCEFLQRFATEIESRTTEQPQRMQSKAEAQSVTINMINSNNNSTWEATDISEANITSSEESRPDSSRVGFSELM